MTALNDGGEKIHDVTVSLLGVTVGLTEDVTAVQARGSVESLQLLVQQPCVVVNLYLPDFVPGRPTRLIHRDGSGPGNIGNFPL